MTLRNTTSYSIAGSKFHRLASKSWLDIFGTNLQNIEKGVRRLYIPDPGKILSQRDQSGAEALIVAYLCRAGKFRELFTNGIKPHVFVALHLFRKVWQYKVNEGALDINCDIDKLCDTPIALLTSSPWWKKIDRLIKDSDNWPPSQRYYYIAKQVCHSSNYGITANPFLLNTLEKSRGKIVLQKKDAEMFLEMYHSLFPEIREWHKEVADTVKTTKMLYNLLGDPIRFTCSFEKEKDIKEAYSAIPQCTVAMITRVAVTQYYNFVREAGFNWDILQDNHDSFLTQSPENEWENNQRIMKQFIEPELVNFCGEHFKMKSEGQIGYNWSPFDKDNPDKNPLGLKEVNI